MFSVFDWLIHTDAGLLTRVLIGMAVFTVLAGIDLRRNGKAATCWREYAVLLIAVVVALLYGAVNDQVTVTISPEYFLYGKGLSRALGDNPPINQLRWEAAKVGLKATWSVGLIFGVALLVANNPYGSLPRLRNRQLVRFLPVIPLTAAVFGFIGGWLGYHGYLTWMDSDFQEMVTANLYRPSRFMCAWGVHLGGYAGGLIGTVMAIVLVICRRLHVVRVAPQGTPELVGRTWSARLRCEGNRGDR